MPRLNAPRSIASEANLAQRVARERERRGLSYEALAKLLTDVGCSIAGSAIFKIEKAQPPRRITVDELMAFSEVFDLPVTELLKPIELVDQERAAELLVDLQERNRELHELVGSMFTDFVNLAVVWQQDEDVYDYVMSHFRHSPIGSGGDETVRDETVRDETVREEPVDGAYDALVFLLTDIASRTWHAVMMVTLSYMNVVLAQEQGEGPTEQELRDWVVNWTAELGLEERPNLEEARRRLIDRVEAWTERMKQDG